jgi:hypothetical protein
MVSVLSSGSHKGHRAVRHRLAAQLRLLPPLHGTTAQEVYLAAEFIAISSLRPELDSLVRDFFTSLHFGLVG